MNRQDVFNTVVKHLLAQGVRCADPLNGCLYRSPKGTKCAVGALIPDEMYDSLMERRDVRRLLRDFPSLVQVLGVEGGEDEDFLFELQSVHDNRDPEDWRASLGQFAQRHKLEMPA